MDNDRPNHHFSDIMSYLEDDSSFEGTMRDMFRRVSNLEFII